MTIRHTVYDRIQELLSDGRWHDIGELGEVTPYASEWVRELTHEPSIEIQDSRGRTLVRKTQLMSLAAAQNAG